MFHYKNLHVYSAAKQLFREIRSIILYKKPDRILSDQLYRAALSILLNIVEGAGRHTNRDKRNFYVIARASVFEVSELISILYEEEIICDVDLQNIHEQLEQISKMLFKMIKVYSVKVSGK